MVDGCSETWRTHLSMLGIVPEVKLGDLMSGEEDVPDSIVSCRPNSHWHALEGLSPNPPKDTDGRREESGRGVRELQGK